MLKLLIGKLLHSFTVYLVVFERDMFFISKTGLYLVIACFWKPTTCFGKFKQNTTLINTLSISHRLDVPAELVTTVYKTANILKIHKAAEACSAYLADHLTAKNCLGESALSFMY